MAALNAAWRLGGTVRAGLPVVSFAQVKALAWRLARAKTTDTARLALAIVGAPGTGKSALPRWLARALKRPLIQGMNGASTREDVCAMAPLPDGSVARIPVGGWAQAVREPCVIFVDEFSRIPLTDQAGPLSAVQDFTVGDAKLHPETFFILAWNDEGSTGAGSVAGAMRNRVCCVYLQPTAAEVGQHFMARAAIMAKTCPAGARMLAALGAAFQFRPDLLQLDPDAIAQAEQSGQTWASSRAWEKATLNGGDDELTDLIWSGTVGCEAAAAFRGVLALGATLPTEQEVCDAPLTVRLPEKPEGAVAAIGLVTAVARVNPDAAVLYASRLPQEIRGALVGMTRGVTGKLKTSAGQKAHRILLGEATMGEE